MSRRDELAGAFMLLTRLPVGWLSRAETAPAACVWAYPLVGAVAGGVAAGVFWATSLALPPAVAAVLAVAAGVLTTGGLHEDGLADTADGFGGGSTAARKLEIMRDSRIGTFGALALLLSVGLRVAVLASLSAPGAAVALMVAGALGRGAMLLMLLRLRPARAGGLAAPLGEARGPVLVAGLVLTGAFSIAAPGAGLAALVSAFAMIALARREVGGYTGDVLGATEQAVECAALIGCVGQSL